MNIILIGMPGCGKSTVGVLDDRIVIYAVALSGIWLKTRLATPFSVVKTGKSFIFSPHSKDNTP